jgi:hypothetical protein
MVSILSVRNPSTSPFGGVVEPDRVGQKMLQVWGGNVASPVSPVPPGVEVHKKIYKK